MALVLRHHAFKIYKRGVQEFSIGDLSKKYRYMASKLDRLDPAFVRQERVYPLGVGGGGGR